MYLFACFFNYLSTSSPFNLFIYRGSFCSIYTFSLWASFHLPLLPFYIFFYFTPSLFGTGSYSQLTVLYLFLFVATLPFSLQLSISVFLSPSTYVSLFVFLTLFFSLHLSLFFVGLLSPVMIFSNGSLWRETNKIEIIWWKLGKGPFCFLFICTCRVIPY